MRCTIHFLLILVFLGCNFNFDSAKESVGELIKMGSGKRQLSEPKHGIVIGNSVRLRSRPSLHSEVKEILNKWGEICEVILYGYFNKCWVKVRVTAPSRVKGLKGFIYGGYVRCSPTRIFQLEPVVVREILTKKGIIKLGEKLLFDKKTSKLLLPSGESVEVNKDSICFLPCLPTPNFHITSHYGIRYDPVLLRRGQKKRQFHAGWDIGCKEGTPIFAIASGKVTRVSYSKRKEWVVEISHHSDVVSIYKHLSKVYVKEDELVSRGECIGTSGGGIGYSTGPHLHLEIWKRGRHLNPRRVFFGEITK